jgi:hypothetical protein
MHCEPLSYAVIRGLLQTLLSVLDIVPLLQSQIVAQHRYFSTNELIHLFNHHLHFVWKMTGSHIPMSSQWRLSSTSSQWCTLTVSHRHKAASLRIKIFYSLSQQYFFSVEIPLTSLNTVWEKSQIGLKLRSRFTSYCPKPGIDSFILYNDNLYLFQMIFACVHGIMDKFLVCPIPDNYENLLFSRDRLLSPK